MKSRRARSAPNNDGECQYRRARSRPADRYPEPSHKFISCPVAVAGSEAVPTPGHAVSTTAVLRRPNLETEPPVDWVDCPECGLPAFVMDRFVIRSTDGPLPHAITVCARMHHLCSPDDSPGDPVDESDEEAS
jgi:hypothetical protein